MYAVIETGGKQYRVELGSEIAGRPPRRRSPGRPSTFDRVLLVADGEEAAIGSPSSTAPRVSADVVRQDRGEKIVVFKYRPRPARRVKKGHRAELTVLRIADIASVGRSAAKEAARTSRRAARPRERSREGSREAGRRRPGARRQAGR